MFSRLPMLAAAACVAAVLLPRVARADTIVTVLDPSSLGANDSLSWLQLGGDNTHISQVFSVTSTNGVAVGGSFATSDGGVICSGLVSSCGLALSPAGLQAINSAPLTLTFPGIAGIGATIGNAESLGSINASLSLYNGATLLGTVTGSSDGYGNPFYLGALDQTGANITSAVYRLTSLGDTLADLSYVQLNFDALAGHIDQPYCFSLTEADFADITNALNCPQTAFGTYGVSNVYAISEPLPDYPDLTYEYHKADGSSWTPAISDPTVLQIATLNLVTAGDETPSGVPEPATVVLFGAALLGLRGLRRGQR